MFKNYSVPPDAGNFVIQLEYDGSGYLGFQKQGNLPTIQFELERALSTFCAEQITVVAAGRTDTGVHALYQVVNFITNAKRTASSLVRGVNALLPHDIAIRRCEEVAPEFNARLNAISRTYNYYLLNNSVRPAILNKKVGWYYKPLNLVRMGAACNLLVGEHDFSSFRASGCQASTPVRHMLEVQLTKIPNFFNVSNTTSTLELNTTTAHPDSIFNTHNGDTSENFNPLICFKFRANAFLYHMVRNLIGALVYVGDGRLSVEDFATLINNKDRKAAPPTFMPDGLYLSSVEYKTAIF